MTDVLAFSDTNKNGLWDKGIDLQLGNATLPNTLAPAQNVTVQVPVKGVAVFRDAPIYVVVNAATQITEISTINNTRSTVDEVLVL